MSSVNENAIGFVVESAVRHSNGGPAGIARLYVADEARAKEIAAAHPGRTYRAIPYDEMPATARANLEREHAGV